MLASRLRGRQLCSRLHLARHTSQIDVGIMTTPHSHKLEKVNHDQQEPTKSIIALSCKSPSRLQRDPATNLLRWVARVSPPWLLEVA
jgi:hypothetical protein